MLTSRLVLFLTVLLAAGCAYSWSSGGQDARPDRPNQRPTGNEAPVPRPGDGSAGGGSGGSGGGAQFRVADWSTTPPSPGNHPARLIAWFPIGNSSSHAEDRRIGWDLKRIGWSGFVERWAKPAIELGFDGIQIHNPGGTLLNEEMQADQFIAAREAGLRWISDGFAEAWRPITARTQVIAYLGMLTGNERLERLARGPDRAAFWRVVDDSYALPLAAGMDIGFDALHNVKADGWEMEVYRYIKGKGVKAYVETAPNVRDRVLYDSHFQIMNKTLERTLKNRERWMAPLEQLTGERVILLADPPEGCDWKNWREWMGHFMAHWLDQGWTVAVNPAQMIEARVRPADLIAEARRRPR